MEEITLKLPNGFREIIEDIDEPLYIEAIKSVAKKKLLQKEKKIKTLQKSISKFETKYKMSFDEFAKNLPDTFQAHEDWVEWTYLNEVVRNLGKAVDKLNLLLKK